jgi:hypothetical protein
VTEAPFVNETVVVPEGHAPAIDLELEMDASIARGVYSNVILVSHSREEFTLEFAYMQPSNRALVHTRVIVPAGHVHELANALLGQLARQAERFPSAAHSSG